MKILEMPRYGPLFRFADHHIYRTLSLLSSGRRVGRKRLADEVGIGEGSMRKIVNVLKEREMIDVRQTGVRISPKGLAYFNELPVRMEEVRSPDMTISDTSIAVQVKGAGNRISTGIEQRDAAIKAGADGATTVVMLEDRLLVPPDYDLDANVPETAKVLRDRFDLEDGDVIIVGTSTDPRKAANGALAAAFDIV
jgi:predicted transcriptional regulator